MPRNMFPALFGERNKLPLSYEQRLKALADKRKFAESLRAQALQPNDPGKMVSGHYVADPWSGLANMAKAWMSRRDVDSADKEEADLVAERQKEFERAIGEVPTDTPDVSMAGAPGEQEAPTMIPGKKVTPQDWVKWGGRMSQLGPQGQAIGQAAIERSIGNLLPKAPGSRKWKEVKAFDDATGREQVWMIDENDPSVRVRVGGNKAPDEPKDPNGLALRGKVSSELIALYRKGETEGSLSPEDQDKIAALETQLDTFKTLPVDGVVRSVNEARIAWKRVRGIPESAPDGAPEKIPPGVAETVAKHGVAYVTPDGKVSATNTPAKGGMDPWADYRKGGSKYDIRNERYLPPVGDDIVTAGTGHIQRLNDAVQEVSKRADAEAIPTLDSAFADLKVALQNARAAAKKQLEGGPKRSLLERGWDQLRVGGGVGGPLGINNIIPNLFTSPEGVELRRAVERVKAFDRNKLFGQTLTGNERESFERIAGTMFGVDDVGFLSAMNAMERSYDEGKRNLFGSFSPLVVDEYFRGRANARTGSDQREPKKPYLSGKF